ncbi:MAG: hypothetical protein K0Q89_2296, partial [Thermomicrobiales bacterium]|nr:hypothetical protein [Thermomicrobiales bacterium]
MGVGVTGCQGDKTNGSPDTLTPSPQSPGVPSPQSLGVPFTTSAASNHPATPLWIDVADRDRSTVRNRLAATSPAAAPPFAVARFGLVSTRGIADRGPTVGTNVD